MPDRPTFLDDDQIEHSQISIDDAASDRLALSLASSPGSIAGVAFAE